MALAGLFCGPLLTVGGASAEGPPVAASAADPWAFNLTMYAWLAGVNGTYRAGPISRSVDVSFIDIAGKLSNVPIAFMGRFEAHYERFGFYLDGNYMDLTFSNRRGPRGLTNIGLSTQLGLMDYGLMYRLAGPAPSERSNWVGKKQPNRLDVYVGGRTFWLDNTLNPRNAPDVSTSATLTAPVFGGRFLFDITPDWFVMADGNLGGFGADNVDFTGVLQGLVAYRTSVFDVPASVELGYRALRINVQTGRQENNTTLNGPFAGFTAYW